VKISRARATTTIPPLLLLSERMAVNSECYLKYKYSIAVLHLISICHLLVIADRIGELKDAMLKHMSPSKRQSASIASSTELVIMMLMMPPNSTANSCASR
jgi:hypothetical protein